MIFDPKIHEIDSRGIIVNKLTQTIISHLDFMTPNFMRKNYADLPELKSEEVEEDKPLIKLGEMEHKLRKILLSIITKPDDWSLMFKCFRDKIEDSEILLEHKSGRILVNMKGGHWLDFRGDIVTSYGHISFENWMRPFAKYCWDFWYTTKLQVERKKIEKLQREKIETENLFDEILND